VRTLSGGLICFTPSGASARPQPAAALIPEQTAETPDGLRYYIEASSLRLIGNSQWRFELGAVASTFPAVDTGGTVYVGTASGRLLAIDGRARLQWAYQAPVRITAGPAIGPAGTVLFGCGDRNLYCVRNGELMWRFPTQGPIHSSPVVDVDGSIYFGSDDGNLYAVDSRGQKVWQLNLESDIRSSPAVDRAGRLYVASISRRLYCIGERTGPGKTELQPAEH
jgi:outer membrane protein assembly factor BamB